MATIYNTSLSTTSERYFSDGLGGAFLAAVVSLIYFDGLIARAGLRLLWRHVPAGGSCQM